MSVDREVVVGTRAVAGEAGTTEAHTPAAATPANAIVPTTSAVALHGEVTHALCENCAETLTGQYCWNCGQRAEHPVHSLWHFISEAAEDLTHADSRLWRTLGALLFKPGFLTTEFLAGRRVRYLPPIRLYLVMSVVLFLFLSINTGHVNVQTKGLTQADRDEIYRETGHKVTDDYQILGPSKKLPQERRAGCARLDAEMSAKPRGVIRSAINSLVHKTCLSGAEDNGHGIGEAFMHTLPKALFMTLPVIAGLMRLLYRRPARYYVEHLLFLLHNYAFLFLWFSILILLSWIITADVIMQPLALVMSLYPLYYYFRGMRRVYPEGVGRTVAKFTLLSSSYLVVAVMALVATAVYSVLAQ